MLNYIKSLNLDGYDDQNHNGLGIQVNDDSQETKNLEEEILEESIENDDGLRKRLEAGNGELRKQNQYKKDVIKTLQDEIEELKKSVEQLGKENRLLD